MTPHTDITFLTTLVPARGLRLLCRGRWHDVDESLGAVLVLPGHLLSVVTGDRVPPMLHEVVGVPLAAQRYPTDAARAAIARGRRLSITAQFRPQLGPL